MDLLKLIREKAAAILDQYEIPGIREIINHIEIAERHLKEGQNGDEFLFTDTIYRTNQAFEGSLKEAYAIITGKDASKKKPYEIETYFSQNKILKDRVLKLFENYRREWRNTSTHDYNLSFSEQEAFLAIVNILAFFNILLDQIIEKLAEERQKRILEDNPIENPDDYKDLDFIDQVTQILLDFHSEIPGFIRGSTVPHISEREIVGALYSYLYAADSNIKVEDDLKLSHKIKKTIMRPDFILSKNGKSLILEVKVDRNHNTRNQRFGQEQVIDYMNGTEINNGILFVAGLGNKLNVNKKTFRYNKIPMIYVEIGKKK